MANAPLHQCSKCRKLVRGKCGCTKPTWTRSVQSERAQQLYTAEWAKTSKRFRMMHPLCAECQRNGRTTAAQCVDHVIPHRADYELFWRESNWESLCNDCHRAKTARGE
jgi:5-methylcytosine-specific restriction protein A